MTATLRTVVFFTIAIAAAPSLAARSDWAVADNSKLRLLIAGAAGPKLSGGIEILLDPGWHTYWRNPGETGVPPSFDFSASENVSSVEVFYPAPERFDDGASFSLIYRDEVVFPIAVTPVDRSRPVHLKLAASFGACDQICVPTRAAADLNVPIAAPADPLADARLALYLARVPTAPEPGRFDLESVTLDKDSLLIDIRAPHSSYSDLFVEPPSGWYIGQAKLLSQANGLLRYRLPLAGKPNGANARGQRFRFVAVAGAEAIEKTVEIR
jgi:DsbC/DsbD-like thiol-disulfide interchange protein